MAINRFDDIPGLVSYWSATESNIVKSGNNVTTVDSVYGADANQLVQLTVGSNFITHDGTTKIGQALTFINDGVENDSGLTCALINPLDQTNGITVAMLSQRLNTGGWAEFLINSTSGSDRNGIVESGGNYAGRSNGATRTVTPDIPLTTNPTILIYRISTNADSLTIFVDGVKCTSTHSAPSSLSNEHFTLANRAPDGNAWGHNNFALAAIYSAYLDDTQCADLNTLIATWRDTGEGPSTGPPGSVTFGPVATNDDPSVTEWNWEASADGGANWDEAENVLSDVSGEATTSLVVNSATLAENGTQVRCRAKSAKEPAGVESAVATLTVQAQAISGDLTLAFSDLVNGKHSGWSVAESTKGVAVTIWGFNFGSSRGSSYVTIGGVDLTSDNDYPEPWGEAAPTCPWMQKICFHLNSSIPVGATTISVTVGGETSNTLPFEVHNDGNIYFIAVGGTGDGSHDNPWGNADTFMQAANQTLGDVCYWRGGTYPTGTEVNGWGSLSIDATANRGMGHIGYPNEVPKFDDPTNTSSGLFRDFRDYWIVSKFHLIGGEGCIGLAYANENEAENGGKGGCNYNRIIGNNVEGLHISSSSAPIYVGYALASLTGSGAKILGNEVHGATVDGFDHGIYLSGAAAFEGGEVAYNYVHSMATANNSLISINHQNDRVPAGYTVKSEYIHHNWVETTSTGSTVKHAAGIYPFDTGDARVGEDPAEPTYVYNNIVIASGDTAVSSEQAIGCLMTGNGVTTVHFHNNTVVDFTQEGGFLSDFSGTVDNIHWKNNLLSTSASIGKYILLSGNQQGTATFIPATNVYWGGEADSWPVEETSPITGDPELTVDKVNHEVSIGATSSARGAGTDPQLPAAAPGKGWDFYGKKYTGSFDIGAVQAAS